MMRLTGLVRSLLMGGIMGGAIIILLMGVQHVSALPGFITSWASSSALILSSPRSRAARAPIIVIAHIMCGIVGLAIGSVVLNLPTAILLSFTLSLFLMLQLRIMHPPAAANAVIALTTAAPHGALMIGWIGGSLCLAAFALFIRALDGEGDQPG